MTPLTRTRDITMAVDRYEVVEDWQHKLHMEVLALCNHQVVSDSWGDMEGANKH
jgi:hypothetical protein